MPKNMSPEQRKAASERMKAMHARKKAEKETLKPSPAPMFEQTQSMPEYNLEALLRRIEELEKTKSVPTPSVPVTPVTPGMSEMNRSLSGTVIGTFEKYVTDPNYYPDPRPKLMAETRLKRFAFDANYELEWAVTSTSYETIDHVRVKEPKFSLSLVGIIFDDDGEPTKGRFSIKNAVFHEDPEAAIAVAREKGLEIDESNQRLFLDEMRYLRMRDWLFEVFYRPRNDEPKRNIKETVIGGKLVQTWEISSQDSEAVPFGELKTKL